MPARFLITIMLYLSMVCVANANDKMIRRLDDAIEHRHSFLQRKEQRIDSLRMLADSQQNREQQLELYNKLYQEYLTFNFDSAMLYVNRADGLTKSINYYNIRAQVKIHRALSLATSGHFSHAIDILKSIDSGKLSVKLREEYYSACEWTYGVWAEYSDKHTIAPEFTQKSLIYLDSLIEVTDRTAPEYSYRAAEKCLRARNYTDAEKNYLAAIDRVPVDSRLYAQAAYALALTYKGLGNKEKYKEWLVNAAISDQSVPLKENLALQQLAIYLKTEDGDLERANEYLKLALEDAIFYNNRLRMLEIAEKIPNIANVYQDTIERQNGRLKIYLLIIALLMLALAGTVIYVYKQSRKVSKTKDAFARLNEELKRLNVQLSQTNKSREQYVSLFMDLCAAYIDKLNRFPTVLKLKVKNMGDLSSVADRYVRPSEAETREMFFNFDTAFLRLYPNFITEFNTLLRPDSPILPKRGELLNTDLRIYALVRMGITDSNKIALLLFLSSQTIFNHRTQVRN
ncbi:MAG: hypothetical protein K2H75_01730, partial [Muribaculaceae bacterium]|nr:hypothetical protein [Muribaculaceae bacterium]